ncbi:DUF2589 domain-containing protein [Celerinatantimonas sp. YJH-8]|uniref:DUF2589 domain-containing protein n=1 Tax=Celerinatantimonas sp. YJH-8 TaxID=3228714 RepID=UPI0038C6D2C6
MINLEEFVHSIHVATASAGEALIQKNLDLLERFFEPADDDDEDIAHMADIGRSDAKVEAKAGRRAPQNSPPAGEPPKKFMSHDWGGDIPILKPKMVAMQYPTVTKNGPAVQTVNVPLITLIPLSQVELQEMSFSTELDLSVNGDALQVSFPKRTLKAKEMADEGASLGNGGKAKLEVKIAAMETPDGLKYIVDGYERALRAQVPG